MRGSTVAADAGASAGGRLAGGGSRGRLRCPQPRRRVETRSRLGRRIFWHGRGCLGSIRLLLHKPNGVHKESKMGTRSRSI